MKKYFLGEAGIRTPLPDSQSSSKTSLHNFTVSALRFELRLSDSKSDVLAITLYRKVEVSQELEACLLGYKSSVSPSILAYNFILRCRLESNQHETIFSRSP